MKKMMEKSLEERKQYSKKLLDENPMRVPLILDKRQNSKLTSTKNQKSKYVL